MKIVCLSVGKKHDPKLVPAITEYEKRLHAYTDFSFEFIPPSNKSHESNTILERVKPDDAVVLLDERGKQITNDSLVEYLQVHQNAATKRLVIIIGGAFGVEETVRQRSDLVAGLSGLVFPHQVVRLLVVEQLYRSFNLLAGGKYHHS